MPKLSSTIFLYHQVASSAVVLGFIEGLGVAKALATDPLIYSDHPRLRN
jgi:hypothetical protein